MSDENNSRNFECTLTDIITNRKEIDIMPTDAEVAFWVIGAILAIVLATIIVIYNCKYNDKDYVEDIDAWLENYEKIRKRN